MIDALMFMAALGLGALIWHFLTSNPKPGMRVVLPGSPMANIQRTKEMPWHRDEIPSDATHIAWIMNGTSEVGVVHTLMMQTIGGLQHDILASNNPWGPIITKSIELECDIRSRGCEPTGELQYAIVKVDGEGNEEWLGRRGWVNRWSKEAHVWDVFGFLNEH